MGKRRAAREEARLTTCQCAAQVLLHRVSSLSGTLLLPGYVYLGETVSVELEQEKARLLAHQPHSRARSAPSPAY